MTNFQADRKRPTAAWLTPERAVVVVPILAGLALALTLGSAVIAPQMGQLRERREVVDELEQKNEALPGLVQALNQRRLDQADVMAQQLTRDGEFLSEFLSRRPQLSAFGENLQDRQPGARKGVLEPRPVLVGKKGGGIPAVFPVFPREDAAFGFEIVCMVSRYAVGQAQAVPQRREMNAGVGFDVPENASLGEVVLSVDTSPRQHGGHERYQQHHSDEFKQHARDEQDGEAAQTTVENKIGRLRRSDG